MALEEYFYVDTSTEHFLHFNEKIKMIIFCNKMSIIVYFNQILTPLSIKGAERLYFR